MENYLAQASPSPMPINSTESSVREIQPLGLIEEGPNYTVIFLVTIVVFVILLTGLYLFKKKGRSQWRKAAEQKLAELDQMVKSENIFQLKAVIMDADKLLDFVLKNKRIKGETLGERLKNAKDKLVWKDYQNLWEAHKLRNKMSHEMEFSPSPQELREKYAYFRKGIKSL